MLRHPEDVHAAVDRRSRSHRLLLARGRERRRLRRVGRHEAVRDRRGRRTNCTGSPKTCAPLWTAATGGAVFSSPAVAGGVVYVGSLDDKLYAFDRTASPTARGSPKTCAPLWTATSAATSCRRRRSRLAWCTSGPRVAPSPRSTPPVRSTARAPEDVHAPVDGVDRRLRRLVSGGRGRRRVRRFGGRQALRVRADVERVPLAADHVGTTTRRRSASGTWRASSRRTIRPRVRQRELVPRRRQRLRVRRRRRPIFYAFDAAFSGCSTSANPVGRTRPGRDALVAGGRQRFRLHRPDRLRLRRRGGEASASCRWLPPRTWRRCGPAPPVASAIVARRREQRRVRRLRRPQALRVRREGVTGCAGTPKVCRRSGPPRPATTSSPPRRSRTASCTSGPTTASSTRSALRAPRTAPARPRSARRSGPRRRVDRFGRRPPWRTASCTSDPTTTSSTRSALPGTTNCAGNPKTCTPLWSATTGGAVFSSPAVAGSSVYVGSDDAQALRVQRCGHHELRRHAQGLHAAVDRGHRRCRAVVSCGRERRRLRRLRRSEPVRVRRGRHAGCGGAPKTCTPLLATDTGLPVLSSPAVANGMVYVGSFGTRAFRLP